MTRARVRGHDDKGIYMDEHFFISQVILLFFSPPVPTPAGYYFFFFFITLCEMTIRSIFGDYLTARIPLSHHHHQRTYNNLTYKHKILILPTLLFYTRVRTYILKYIIARYVFFFRY